MSTIPITFINNDTNIDILSMPRNLADERLIAAAFDAQPIDTGPGDTEAAIEWLAKRIPDGLEIVVTQYRKWYYRNTAMSKVEWSITVMDGSGYWATASGDSALLAAEHLLRERAQTEAIDANTAKWQQARRDAMPKDKFTIWGIDGKAITFRHGDSVPHDIRMGKWEAMGTVEGMTEDAERRLRELKGAA